MFDLVREDPDHFVCASIRLAESQSAGCGDEVAGSKFSDGDRASVVRGVAYFVLSLPPIARKADQYKHYFHNNIVVHNIIQLKALASGDDFLNLLPPNALRFLQPDDVVDLVYNLGDDMVTAAA